MKKLPAGRWPRVLVTLVLATMLLPALPAPDPVAAQASDSLCTGDPHADYNGPCGPSLSVPAWSDAAGWNDTTYAETISLVDLNGDNKDELVGLSGQGLLVNTWSDAWGQWVPASNLSQPLPFPGGPSSIVEGSLRFGQLAENVWGVVALASDGSGLETWTWNAVDDSPGSGVWTQVNTNGPFNNNDSSTAWYYPAYYSTIQFVPDSLEGAGYSLIARGSDGVHLCSWGGNSWSCKLATSAFNDTLVSNPSSTQQWPNNLADYYYDTIQFGDIYSGSPGPELFGRDNQGGGVLKVYTWDSASQTFTELKPSGNWPFWTDPGTTGWNDVKYSSTIQPVQLAGSGQPEQVIGRGLYGLQWFAISDSGCGGHSAPCWKNLTNNPAQILSDYAGFNDPQFYATIRFVDLNGDGVDEVIARTTALSSYQLTAWGYHASAGWTRINTQDIALTSGPSSDPLWSQPSYYTTLQVGVVTDDQRPTLIARGKYGVRTWMYWDNSGWWRPYPYGFQSFGTQAETNAYDLIGDFLSLAGDIEVRDEYSSANASALSNYASCLEQSIQPSAMMPPAETCALINPPATSLKNSNGVTADQWQAMATLLLGELGQANTVSTHFNVATLEVINDTFFQDEVDLSQALSYLFPSPPDSSSHVSTSMFNLFTGFGEAASIAAGQPELNAALHVLTAVVGAMGSTQGGDSVYETRIEDLQNQIDTATTQATGQNTALFEYIASDRGLLTLYGTLINDGYWQLDAGKINAAESIGQYNNTIWIYQTMLPLYWQVGVCNWNDNCGDSNVQSWLEQYGTNVSGPWWASLSQINSPFDGIPDQGDTLSTRVFGSVQDTCQIGGTDPTTSWDYSNHNPDVSTDPNSQKGTGCNLGLSTTPLLYFEDGWTFTCLVITGSDAPYQAYNCGQGPPDGYGPPGS